MKQLPSGKDHVNVLRLHAAMGMQGQGEEKELRLHISFGNAAFAWVSPAQQVTCDSTGLGVLLSPISALVLPCIGKIGF